MCGRYMFSSDDDREEYMRIIKEVNEKYHGKAALKEGEIYPTDKVPVLVSDGKECTAELISWGYPHFTGKGVIVNARSESITEKKMFSNGFENNRCVVPATGFFEWKDTGKSKKDKYLFTLPKDDVIYMAGVWDEFDGERRFVILTTEANESTKDIHHRMPVIIPSDKLDEWVSGDLTKARKMIRAEMPSFEKALA